MRSSSPMTRRCSTRSHRRKRTKRMRNRTHSKRYSTSMRSQRSQSGRSTWKARRQKPATPAGRTGRTGRQAERQAQGPMRRRCGVRALRPCHVLRIPCTQAAWGAIAGSVPSSLGAGVGPRGRRSSASRNPAVEGRAPVKGPLQSSQRRSASPRRCTRPLARCLLASQQRAAVPHTGYRLATFCIPY